MTYGARPPRDQDQRRALLAREAKVLEAARHPGVVELLAVEEGADGPVLLTAPADGTTLAHLPALGVEEVAGVVAAVASTLADLHDLGLVHGALTAEQVLVGADGRPLLRGFGHGGRTGDPPVAEAELPPEASDPARIAGGPLEPAADVLALGALLRTLLQRNGSVPGESAGERLRGGRDDTGADALRSVADRATVADPRFRLSARALAAAVGHAVPGARLPRQSGPDNGGVGRLVASSGEPPPTDDLLAARRRQASADVVTPSSRHRSLFAVGAVGALALAVMAALMATKPSSTPAPFTDGSVAGPPAPPPLRVEPTTVFGRSPAVPLSTMSPGRGCPEIDAVLSADTDGDGCPEAIRWADGVVEAGVKRWSVGRAGDLVATGDWSCRGVRTLALLRPATGEVFVFDGWASADRDLTTTALARVEEAFALRAADLDTDGCPELLVERAGRPPVTVARPHR